MREINNLREIQVMELEILKKFAQFCEVNGLRYFIEFGTLLGAAQFKGFIPWDDDIDVAMPRPDYEKFLFLTRNGIDETYTVLSTKHDSDYAFPFAKIIDNRTTMIEEGIREKYKIGLYIDVFPLDGLPQDESEIEKHFHKINKCIKRLQKSKYKLKGRTFIRSIAKLILFSPYRLVGTNRLVGMIEKEAKKFSFDNSKYISVTVWGGGHRQVFVIKENYLNSEKLTFEGEEFSCPGKYEQYLALLYGNYKKLPPINKQVSHHHFKLYLK